MANKNNAYHSDKLQFLCDTHSMYCTPFSYLMMADNICISFCSYIFADVVVKV